MSPLILIAETNQTLVDFGPYVPAINHAGTVTFQAKLVGGSSSIFSGEKLLLVDLLKPFSDIHQVISHPALSENDVLGFYGLTRANQMVAVTTRSERCDYVAQSPLFQHIGPLGPTINAIGEMSFRAIEPDGQPGIFMTQGAQVVTVAKTGRFFSAFQGLPVIHNDGFVVFRADLCNGSAGIFRYQSGAIQTLVQTGASFVQLGLFPSSNNDGTVLFSATDKCGQMGIYLYHNEQIDCLIHTTQYPFAHIRGGLINDHQDIFVFATSATGQLGIYALPNIDQPLLAIEMPFEDSTIAEFALNPVSINVHGQLVIRVKLQNQRQLILRWEPPIGASFDQ